MLRKRVVERLEREKVQAHREARYWKAQWGQARNALEAARAEAKDLRRVSKDALHLRSEVDRLETLLADIDVDTRKRSTMASLRIENGRLQAGSEALGKQLQEVESERDELCSQVETLSRAQFGRKDGHPRAGALTGKELWAFVGIALGAVDGSNGSALAGCPRSVEHWRDHVTRSQV